MRIYIYTWHLLDMDSGMAAHGAPGLELGSPALAILVLDAYLGAQKSSEPKGLFAKSLQYRPKVAPKYSQNERGEKSIMLRTAVRTVS